MSELAQVLLAVIITLVAMHAAWRLGRDLGRVEGERAIFERQREHRAQMERLGQRILSEELARHLGATLSDEELAKALDKIESGEWRLS